MGIRVALNHKTSYHYAKPVWLSPHVVRLRPAPHCRTPVVSYSLKVVPAEHFINWQQDPYSNRLARLVFPKKTTEFSVEVDLVADLTVTNPFDFFLEKYAEEYPFQYDPVLARELVPYLETAAARPKLQQLIRDLRKEKLRTVDYLVDLNQQIHNRVKYIIRLEPGIQTPEETLTLRSGSCRDSAWLLVQLLRQSGAGGALCFRLPDSARARCEVARWPERHGKRRHRSACVGRSLSSRRGLGGPRSHFGTCSRAKGTFRWRVRPIRRPPRRSPGSSRRTTNRWSPAEPGARNRRERQGQGPVRIFDVGHAHPRRSARHQALHRRAVDARSKRSAIRWTPT